MDKVMKDFNEILREYKKMYDKNKISFEQYYEMFTQIDRARNDYAIKVLKNY